jgi:hypothetical protein
MAAPPPFMKTGEPREGADPTEARDLGFLSLGLGGVE